MGESNLSTAVAGASRPCLGNAECCESGDEAGELTTAVESTSASTGTPPPASATSALERLPSRLSLVLGAALAVAVTILAIGYLTSARDRVSARAKHSTHPIDWLLWFGGAKPDQTFEKFVKDTTAKSQREWDEKYRNSPAFQTEFEGVDWSRRQGALNPAPSFTKPPRRSP